MMQVIAYLRHIEHLPANLETILESLNNAINFKVFVQKAHEILGDETDTSDDIQSDSELERYGIEGNSLFWSFGPYAKFFIGLVTLFAIYYLFLFMLTRFRSLHKLVKILRKKLFYSSIIRFMI